jgi:hypothetical protein
MHQLAFDWPVHLLDRNTRLRLYWEKKHEIEGRERQERDLWHQGHYAEVSPPLCWLCPWVHSPPGGNHGLCPLYNTRRPATCTITEHIYWKGVSSCPWCGGPAYIGRSMEGWVANSGTIHVLPACFGPKRYVCSRCWRESEELEQAFKYTHIFCVLCPMVQECELAYE